MCSNRILTTTTTTTTTTTSRRSLIEFKPRSVLLLLNQKSSMKKTIVHHCLSLYLHNNGFSKTLKKFLSESNLLDHDDDSWKDCSLDLEQLIYKCLDTRSQPNTISDGVEQVISDVLTKSSNGFGNEPLLDESNKKSKDKKKKKTKSGSDSIVENGQTEAQPVTKEKSKDLVAEADSETIKPKKDKKKKKKKEKLISDSLAVIVEQGVDKCVNVQEKSVKSKTKKKLKDSLVLQNLPYKEVDKLDKGKSRNDSEKKDFETSEDVATNTENRDSRKRKRLASEENNSEPVEKVANDECKRRKTEGMEESQQNKQLDSQTNGNLETYGENSSVQKSLKKQHNGSVEPKTVHAFQRVKMDKVVFTDERLQDNSYWAKDGAEIGYGAKAQEVLGQVRGRDFRHEKTKKKRGSYRGGQIDLHSHSVKFNYSDED